MNYKKFVQPKSLDQALDLLKSEKDAVVIGGTTFLRLADKEYSTAIDLTNLKLNFIKEVDNNIEIGAYTSLRELEVNPLINKYFGNIIPKAVRNIIGVQFRNSTTVGGSVFGRYGFSELINSLHVLDCEVVLAENGKMHINDYLLSNIREDILEKIVIHKHTQKNSYQMLRNANSDFPLLSVAASKRDIINISVAARPAGAETPKKALKFINENDLTDENIKKCSEIAAEELIFGSDIKASAEYRKNISKVLIKRALMEVK